LTRLHRCSLTRSLEPSCSEEVVATSEFQNIEQIVL
jgi:hypothetical protein